MRAVQVKSRSAPPSRQPISADAIDYGQVVARPIAEQELEGKAACLRVDDVLDEPVILQVHAALKRAQLAVAERLACWQTLYERLALRGNDPDAVDLALRLSLEEDVAADARQADRQSERH